MRSLFELGTMGMPRTRLRAQHVRLMSPPGYLKQAEVLQCANVTKAEFPKLRTASPGWRWPTAARSWPQAADSG